jgi:tetratricopeptide (TPR) repeat protein
MKSIFLSLICSLFIVPGIAPVWAQAGSSLQWYQKVYGSLAESDHPLVAQAHEVFAHVAAAADKPGDRYPRLLIVPSKKDPWALCLKDGGIVLSQKALEFCYKGVPSSIGASRLAFVLGHEIAHLAKGDFWHAEISEFISHYDSQTIGLERFRQLVKDPSVIRSRELQADYHGMLYSFMAGYDPRVIVKQKDVNFFVGWTNQLVGKIAYDEQSYPSAKLRANHLLVLLDNINFQIELFELGLRLYQKGDYDTAMEYLMRVRRQLPSREILNDIGLIFFQTAMDELSCYDNERAQRHKLSTVLDTEIRAGIRGDADACQKAFNIAINSAITNFQEACIRDAHYIPARVNLASAYILNGDYSNALATLDQIGKAGQGEQNVLNNKAVALYLFGGSNKIDTTKQALEMLETILRDDPGHPAALYNLGSMLFEQNRHLDAKNKWLDFLNQEPNGYYAASARRILGNAASKNHKKRPAGYHVVSPIKLGLLNEDVKKKLEVFSAIDFDTIGLDGISYSHGDVKVLVSRGFVQFVEVADEKRTKLSKILSRYGRPDRIIATAAGLHTYVYKKFAVDIQKDRVIKVLHF